LRVASAAQHCDSGNGYERRSGSPRVYLRTIGKRVASAEQLTQFDREFDARWRPLGSKASTMTTSGLGRRRNRSIRTIPAGCANSSSKRTGTSSNGEIEGMATSTDLASAVRALALNEDDYDSQSSHMSISLPRNLRRVRSTKPIRETRCVIYIDRSACVSPQSCTRAHA
jgi:hypothetical protein